MIAIIDYGVGNLFSLKSSFGFLGHPITVTGDPHQIRQADKILLPGVGAFGDAIEKLRHTGLDQVLVQEAQAGKPLLGVCLGMQLLFESSCEYGQHLGLGLIPGQVVPLSRQIPPGLKIPHMGWNALTFPKDRKKHELFKYVEEGDCAYFVHSYCGVGCDAFLAASSEYGTPITAAVARGNVWGCQFHPEKSGPVGLNILRAFCETGGSL